MPVDIFNNSAFTWMEMTDSINVVPNKYGRLQQIGLFTRRGVTTRTVSINIEQGTLNLLPTRPVGGTPTLGTMAKGKIKSFTVPHIPHDDQVLAQDVQGVLGAAALRGDGTGLKSVQELVNEKLATMRAKHDITLEYLRWGAVSGIILDADGSVILNLFTDFGLTEKVIDFELDVDTTDVAAKVMELKTWMEDNLFGEQMNGIRVFASPTFFSALIKHPAIKEYLTQFRGTARLGEDYRNAFEYMGVIFEQQSGRASDIDGNVHKFVADGTARAVPLGTEIFKTYDAPADFNEAVNTPGLPIYAKQKTTDFERGIRIHTQSNPLPLALRPQLLVKLTI